jgi:hypothetical protein
MLIPNLLMALFGDAVQAALLAVGEHRTERRLRRRRRRLTLQRSLSDNLANQGWADNARVNH